MAENGYLTQKMHREFWNEIKQLGTPQEIDLIKKSLNANVLIAQQYQRELWESAKKSYENRRVVKTPRLTELETELPVKFEKSLPYPKTSASYRQAMNSYKKHMEASMENSKRLLKSAAERSSMTSTQGQSVPLNMAMIDAVLTNLTSSFARLKDLLNENWDGK
ncbi:hypothetical protein [Salinisphaera sp. T5B8]|uniref:hypothetical protein n=1 Tax=Salinisphaera sp. T5B8 TaxID=1304154 RepID=UPI003341606C